ncbi:MAG: hypothetical protein JSS89_00605 [Bacteroidetes bacterium]|nr:hypothetical protein [Bacteroidota bacterium]
MRSLSSVRAFVVHVVVCIVTITGVARSQSYYAAPSGRVSVGAYLGTSLYTVSSDVVGAPDHNGDSHTLTTTMFVAAPGIELAYDIDHSTSSVTSLRARVISWLTASASDLVHVHDDTVIGTPNDIVITSQHTVEHTISRFDAQFLVAHEFLEIPIRIQGGLSYGFRMSDKVSETIRETKRDTVPHRQIVKGERPQVLPENSVTIDHYVTQRIGLLMGIALPFRFGNVEFVPSLEYDLGISTNVPVDANEAPIPYTSNAMVISFAFLYRL